MPKLNQILKNMIHDKQERSSECYHVVVENHNIPLCNAATGNKINSAEELPGIGRYNGGSHLDYCLSALAEKGILGCGIPTQVIEIFHSQIVQCSIGQKDLVQPRPVLIEEKQGEISLGNSLNKDGLERAGCTVLIRDFNLQEGDRLDFRKIPGLSYNNLTVENCYMNDHPSKAISINGDINDCLIGLYDFPHDMTLMPDMFIFAPHHLHTEL